MTYQMKVIVARDRKGLETLFNEWIASKMVRIEIENLNYHIEHAKHSVTIVYKL